MPFKPGQSGNPAGYPKPKRYWITEKQRVVQARKSFKTLCEIRDGRIKEQQTDENGKVYDVAPSVREVRESAKSIMAYAIGLPAQALEISGEDGEPFAFNVILKEASDNGAQSDAGAGGIEFHYGGSNGQSR